MSYFIEKDWETNQYQINNTVWYSFEHQASVVPGSIWIQKDNPNLQVQENNPVYLSLHYSDNTSEAIVIDYIKYSGRMHEGMTYIYDISNLNPSYSFVTKIGNKSILAYSVFAEINLGGEIIEIPAFLPSSIPYSTGHEVSTNNITIHQYGFGNLYLYEVSDNDGLILLSSRESAGGDYTYEGEIKYNTTYLYLTTDDTIANIYQITTGPSPEPPIKKNCYIKLYNTNEEKWEYHSGIAYIKVLNDGVYRYEKGTVAIKDNNYGI